jgi:hypothetical protein
MVNTIKFNAIQSSFFGNLFKFLRVFVVGLFALCAIAFQATVVISNAPNATLGGSPVSDTDLKALMFTSGAVTSTVKNISLGLNPPAPNTDPVPFQAKVEIAPYSVVAGIPSAQLAALIPPVPTFAEWALVLLASFMTFVAWRSVSGRTRARP